ncbi:unnamed protein product [Chironomus riparius]|uniref:Peptidase S1 domain-containing protein n=1 Tax=Chironomus riparius TaxID=315576 RepID=A0A9N9WZH7_9DIPT|nr:unnamed protein product [Chironomus riparius]
MKPKSLLLLIFFVIITKVHAELIDCNFEVDDVQFYDGFEGEHKDVLSYGCKIQNIGVNDEGNDIKVNGDHMENQTDEDVTYFINEIEIVDYLASFTSDLCSKYPNLMMIHLRFFDIEKLEENSLENCQNLKILNFYGNNITEIPENVFFQNHELTEINIIHNELTTLPQNLFENQAELQWLNLRVNQINSLPSKIFKPLQKLHILNLGANKLQNINSAWFESLEDLKELFLDENQISQIHPDVFRPLQNLEGLDLSFNDFISQKYDQYKHVKSLKSLSLGANELRDLPKKIFLPLKNLEKLWLYGNQLSVVHSEWFGVHKNLVKLDLFYNKVTAVDERLIENSPIAEVDMEGNVCNNQTFEDRIEMRANLSLCFSNYKGQYPSSGTTRRPYQPVRTYATRGTTQRTISSIKTTRKLRITTATTQKSTTASSTLEEPIIINCGKTITGVQTVVGGTQTPRGAYPWNVALLHNKNTTQLKYKYFCGGTLISNKTVVTAAHCLKGKFGSHEFEASDIIVALGVHDLKKSFESGRTNIAVKYVYAHPDWNSNIASFEADIAVLELEHEIQFTNFIQPICLAHSGLNSVATGFVAGFGKSEAGHVENIARTVTVPIHDSKVCAESKDHESILGARSICGGSADGIGVCEGDSGSGLIIQKDGIHFIRGIVSASLYAPLYGCNVQAYSVFTDITKFRSWVMTQEDPHTQLLRIQAERDAYKNKLKELEEAKKIRARRSL